MTNFCPKCQGYLWKHGVHHCPPCFECRFDDQWKEDRDWREVYAADPEAAAEKFAGDYDCENEYSILQEGDRCERIIEVRLDGGAPTRWNISAENVPHYYASEADEAAAT